jgi:hypothetical protein
MNAVGGNEAYEFRAQVATEGAIENWMQNVEVSVCEKISFTHSVRG